MQRSTTAFGLLRFATASSFAAAIFLAACDYRHHLDPTAPCENLDVRVLEQSASPPANVAAVVRVTDCRGRALGQRLEESAFELSENGRLLSPFEATRMIVPAERQTAQRTLVALDLSGSIVRSGIRPAMIEGVAKLLESIEPDDRVAIFGFDGRPDLIPFAYFTDDQVELHEALDRAAFAPLVDDSTNLNGAVLSALAVLDDAVHVDARDVYTVAHGSLVIFTDGLDLAGRASDQEVANALNVTPHSSFAIGVGAGADQASLAAIGRTARFSADDRSGIATAFSMVAAELRAKAEANYVVSYCTPARAGARTLGITVQFESLAGATALGFEAIGFGAGCSPEGSPLH